jgi:hypothetical protein
MQPTVSITQIADETRTPVNAIGRRKCHDFRRLVYVDATAPPTLLIARRSRRSRYRARRGRTLAASRRAATRARAATVTVIPQLTG